MHQNNGTTTQDTKPGQGTEPGQGPLTRKELRQLRNRLSNDMSRRGLYDAARSTHALFDTLDALIVRSECDRLTAAKGDFAAAYAEIMAAVST